MVTRPAPLTGEAVATALFERGHRLVSGVPCGQLSGLIDAIEDTEQLEYVAAANEGAALAVASGAWLGGERSAVLLQNSGLGNLINPLASLNIPYGIPVLLLISMRGYPDPAQDEPQHQLMGIRTAPILRELGVPYAEAPDDPQELASVLAQSDAAFTARQCFALLVRRGTIAAGRPAAWAGQGPMTRLEAVRVLTERLAEQDAVIATTGLIGREFIAASGRELSFASAGSMGHALAIGLGLALRQRDRRVVVLDGDGALVMHMGSLSTVGHHRPANLVHVVLDNGCYGSTGGQPATSTSADLAAAALACGYESVIECRTASELDKAMASLGNSGPAFLRVMISSESAPVPPRVTRVRGSLTQQAAQFRAAILREN